MTTNWTVAGILICFMIGVLNFKCCFFASIRWIPLLNSTTSLQAIQLFVFGNELWRIDQRHLVDWIHTVSRFRQGMRQVRVCIRRGTWFVDRSTTTNSWFEFSVRVVWWICSWLLIWNARWPVAPPDWIICMQLQAVIHHFFQDFSHVFRDHLCQSSQYARNKIRR